MNNLKLEQLTKEIINKGYTKESDILDFDFLDNDLKEQITKELKIISSIDYQIDLANDYISKRENNEPVTTSRVSDYFNLSLNTSSLIKDYILDLEDSININDGLIIRNIYKENKIKYNNNNHYIDKTLKEEYIKRLKEPYVKNGITKSFYNQFINGDGHELDSKFYNICSSSRLCFDLFSNLKNNQNILDIEFEYHLPSLYSSNNIHGPNMDLYIKRENKISFIEFKYTEYIKNNIEDIPDAYYKELGSAYTLDNKPIKSYLLERYGGNKELEKWLPIFVNSIIKYINDNNLNNKYDWFNLSQAIKHVYGISNWIYKNLNNIKDDDIYFYYIYFDFKDGISKLSNEFMRLINIIMNKYFKDLNIKNKFYFKFLSIQNYLKLLKDNDTSKLLKNRYDIEVLTKKLFKIEYKVINESFNETGYLNNYIEINDYLLFDIFNFNNLDKTDKAVTSFINKAKNKVLNFLNRVYSSYDKSKYKLEDIIITNIELIKE